MAGIGFRINRLLRSDDLYEKMGGVVASVLLSCGPWICTIICIGAISLISSKNGDPLERDIFKVIVNYTFAFSLIGFSLIEMATTRYLADAIYLRQERVIPTLFSFLLTAVLFISVVIAGVFYAFTDLDWRVGLLSAILFSSVSLIWCCTIFLSACKDFFSITIAFIAGMLISVAASFLLNNVWHFGLLGALGGFTVGYILIAVLLSCRIFVEFGTGYLNPRDYFSHCLRNRSYIWVGLFYSLGTWSDKLIFWLSPQTGTRISALFYKSSAYDAGLFMAYLLVVPSMSYFLVKMETRFYTSYRAYFTLIDTRAALDLIDRQRKELIEVMRSEIRTLIAIQGGVSLVAAFWAPQIVEWIGLPLVYTTVFRYGLVASFLHVLMLFSNIMILYFDCPKIVAGNYGIFLITNIVLTFLSTRMEYRYHGLGYAVAALIGLVVTLHSLNKVGRELNFLVFMRQPFGRPSDLPVLLGKVRLDMK